MFHFLYNPAENLVVSLLGISSITAVLLIVAAVGLVVLIRVIDTVYRPCGSTLGAGVGGFA